MIINTKKQMFQKIANLKNSKDIDIEFEYSFPDDLSILVYFSGEISKKRLENDLPTIIEYDSDYKTIIKLSWINLDSANYVIRPNNQPNEINNYLGDKLLLWIDEKNNIIKRETLK